MRGSAHQLASPARRRQHARLAGLGWLVALLMTAAGSPAAVVVSGRLRAEIEPRQGDLVSLRLDAAELLAAPSRAWLLRLTQPGDRSSRWLDPGSASRVRVGETAGTVTVEAQFDEPKLSVTTVWRASDGKLTCETRLTNNSGQIAESVTAPMLRLRSALAGDAAGTRLFMPGGDGYLVSREGWRARPWNGRDYPGHASMQFMALLGGGLGLSLQTRDAEAQPKAFEAPYDSEHDWLEMRVTHRLPFVPDQSANLPAATLLPCDGTWQSAASSYRDWARGQAWAKPKRGADAPPAWLDEGLITLGGSLRPLGLGKRAVELDQWPHVVSELRTATGAPNVMLDLREWEHDGIYTSPFYFPLYPSDDGLKTLLAGAKAAGARATAMVSGLQWMIQREAYTTRTYTVTAFDGRQRFEAEGRPVCIVGRDGQVQIDAPGFNWDGTKARMCPAHSFTQAHFVEAAQRLAEAGFDLFELDQMNGGGCPTCYSTAHGHPPGPGRWQQEAITRFVAAARAAGRRLRPDFATSLEDPSEQLLPYLDSYISRAANLGEWPANGQGSEVVPAFAFVYGPLARPLAIDIQHSVTPDPYQLVLTARAFAAGCLPTTNLGVYGIVYKYGEDDLLPSAAKLDADQRQLLTAVTRARCGALSEFVNRGVMQAVEPPPLAPVTIEYPVWEKDRQVTRQLTTPPVLANCWSLPDGRRALALVNLTRAEQRFGYPPAGGEVRLGPLDATVIVR